MTGASLDRRRGHALLLAMVILLLLEVLLAGVFFTLRVEAHSGIEALAAARAAGAGRAAAVIARDWIERSPPDSARELIRRMPPPVHLPGGAIGFAEFALIDSSLVELLALGVAGSGSSTARRQTCALFRLEVQDDSLGSHSRLVPVPDRPVTNC